MATSVIWPKDLNDRDWIPSFLWDGYSNTEQDVVVRSQMDAGPGVSRRRFTGYSIYHTGKTQMTSRQLLIFESWYIHELMNGALSFMWCAPGMYLWYESRFRKPFNVAPNGAPMTPITIEEGDSLLSRCPDLRAGDKYLDGSWIVSFEIEQMPGKAMRDGGLPGQLDAVDDEFTTAFNTPVSGNVAANDTYPEGATFALDFTTSGLVSMDDVGNFTFTPDADYAGTTSFTYKVCLPSPDEGICDMAKATITVGDHPGYNLNVTKSGTGAGLVTSDPAGINYGTDGTELYPRNASVILIATPDVGSTFIGWSGDAASETAEATVVMTSNKTVNAEFRLSAQIKPDLIISMTAGFPDGLYAVSSGSFQSSGVHIQLEWSRVGSGVWVNAGHMTWQGVNPSSFTSTKEITLHDPDAPAGTKYEFRFTRTKTWYRKKLSALKTDLRIRNIKVKRDGVVIEGIFYDVPRPEMDNKIPWNGQVTNDNYGIWLDEPSATRAVHNITPTFSVV